MNYLYTSALIKRFVRPFSNRVKMRHLRNSDT